GLDDILISRDSPYQHHINTRCEMRAIWAFLRGFPRASKASRPRGVSALAPRLPLTRPSRASVLTRRGRLSGSAMGRWLIRAGRAWPFSFSGIFDRPHLASDHNRPVMIE